MEHKMRRIKQELPREEALAVLDRATSGVLALVDADGAPYAVPMSFARVGESLYFHCANAGHKLEAARACGRASFCAIDQDAVVPAEFTTYFRSAIAFGPIAELEDPAEKVVALRALAAKYSPGLDPTAEIDGSLRRTCVLDLRIERVTGKEARELMEARRKAE